MSLLKNLMFRVSPLLVAVAVAGGCAAQPKYVGNTKVEDTPVNKELIRTLEQYRTALQSKDAGKLLMMASKDYWEDGGTADGNDDYGYSELREVLTAKLQRVSEIRYSLRYKKVQAKEGRAWVDVLVDASFTVVNAVGREERKNVRDRNQFVLQLEGDDWKFLSGM